MSKIFAQVKTVLKRGAPLIVQDNIEGNTFTPLIRDIAIEIARSFTPTGETVVV